MEREHRRAEASALLREARARAGLSAEELAARAGVKRASIRDQEDPELAERPPHLDVLLVEGMLEHIVELLAERAGKVVIDPPAEEVGTDDLRLALDVQKESSDVVRVHLEAIADGYITREENEKVRAEIMEAIRALYRLHLTLERTQHEPVVGVRRGLAVAGSSER